MTDQMTDQECSETDRALAAFSDAVEAAEQTACAARASLRAAHANVKARYPEPSAEARARVRARLAPVRDRQRRVLALADPVDSGVEAD